MIELIASIFSEGDFIKIFFNNSSKSVEGYIFKLLPTSIAIKTLEGKLCGIKGDDIDSFEEGTISNNQDIASTIIVSTPQSPATISEREEKFEDSIDIAGAKLSESGNTQPFIEEKETNNDSEEKNDGQVEEKEETEVNKPANSLEQGFKPGDVIPLDILHQIDPKLKDKPKISSVQKKSGVKMRTLGNDFNALNVLVKDKHEIDDLKIVPALGEIKFVKPEMNFGFIHDGKSGQDLYFSLSQIIDNNVNSGSWYHQAVVYSLQTDAQGQGPKAVTIHKPRTISEMVKLASEFSNSGEYKHAFHLIEQILSEYPDNFSADRLKRQLNRLYPQYNSKQKEHSNAYSKAKKYSTEKFYDKAIEYYYKALDNGEKVESAVKDLGMLYTQLSKSVEDEKQATEYRQKAIEFMDRYVDELSDTLSTLYYLENFYYSVKDYDKFIITVDKLVSEKSFSLDKNKQATLLTKKAVALMQLNMPYEAEEVIDDALSIDPTNLAASRLKNIIENNSDTEDIKSEISITEFESLNSGLSSYIQYILDDYNEFAGVPAKIIESGEYDEKTLKGIRNLIDNFAGRARERAKYLLTEGKLLTILDPDNTVKLRSTMARYCNDMAKNHISNNSRYDIVRFYYNEAFSLENRYDATARQVSYYLLTYCYRFDKLLNATSTDISIDKALSQVLNETVEQKIWEGILTMFMNNSEISAQIIYKLYSNQDYKLKALKALNNFGITGLTNSISKDEFNAAWNKAREIRINDYKKIITSIKIIAEAKNIDSLAENLSKLVDADVKKDWLPALDQSRIHNIINIIVPALDTYRKVSGYRNKESNRNNANGLIQQIIDEIYDGPTKLSFEALLPLMEKTQSLLQSSFADVVKMSEPRLNIQLLSIENVVDTDRTVPVQISVSNHRDSSPIREVSVFIKDSDEITFVQGDATSYNAIDGGENLIFKMKVKVSENVIQNKATVMTAICSYRTGEELKTVESQMSLRLYSSDDFTPIANPYAPVADGGPVPVESNMFYGREEFINNLVDAIIKSPSKQVIIYGQKRCGKSSVLLHLRKQLNDTGKAFCVCFSLGDITRSLSESSFYHKILSSIQTELEFLEMEDQVIPQISFPNWNDFKLEDEENPLNTFTKYMIKFKIACKRTPGWENRNLVVMIDEFTYLYSGIKHGNVSSSIMKQWKAVTQNNRAQFSVVLVGQDVVPSFKKEDYASNAFGVIEDIRLTYLKEEPARELIEKPILNSSGESRYIGNAVSRIIDYTSRNPYYIQIFCDRLVDTMNRNKAISVTEADVNDVARTFIEGSEALPEDKFDNLIRAGESEDLQEYSESHILLVLKQIALNSKNIGYCNREDVRVLEDKEEEDAIFKHLYDREVLELKGDNNYKIQVKLFQEWLLNH